ncbi:hypothetical protein [Rudaea cellulosilytica]|uniref:hypothetical protein n=1 Tax=Rudaea cellulosilytica TaxID=540746 RepID=UPI000382AF58|nr:hypothetical protein [Rudaea cellulosilytica]
MKTLFAILLAAGAMQSAPALAESSRAKAPAPSPLLGSWAVDISRLPMPQEARPQSVTITFADAGGAKWKVNVDIVDAGGTKINAYGTYALDGTAAPGQGSTIEADTGAIKMPAPNVLVMGLGKGGMPASTRVYTVAADGRSMIETAVSFDNVPVMRTFYFTRVR